MAGPVDAAGGKEEVDLIAPYQKGIIEDHVVILKSRVFSDIILI